MSEHEIFLGPPWMDGGGGMRPKFPPRFEGPGEFYRGGPIAPPGAPLGPPGIFDEPPHPRHRRHEDRGRHRPDFEEEIESERRERRSRWSNSSPRPEETVNGEEKVMNEQKQHQPEKLEKEAAGEVARNEEEVQGNTTPLRDEPQEPPQVKEVVAVVDDCLPPGEEKHEVAVEQEAETAQAGDG